MIKSRYYSMNEALELIDESNRAQCKIFLEQEAEILKVAKGSSTKHQAWEGGYLDHVLDTMNVAILLYGTLSVFTGRSLTFSLSDSLLVLFLHDLEKPFKQIKGKELGLVNSSGEKNRLAIREFKESLFKKFGFNLTEQHLNALRYVEGENEDYHPTERVMNELAAFCHMCDTWSARGWHNYPKREGDSWKNNFLVD